MLWLRVTSSVIFLTLVWLSLRYPGFGWFIPAVILVATAIGTWEYCALARKKGLRIFASVAIIFSMTALCAAWKSELRLLPALLAVTLVLIMTAQLILGGIANFAANVGANVFGLLYVSLPMALMMNVVNKRELVVRVVVFFVLVSWSSDTGAYFVGRAFGKNKLAPKISPGKTVEGSLGGVGLSLLSAILLTLLWPGMREIFPLFPALLLALLFSVIGQAGDLVESALKRDAGQKDSGQIYTGMGGMLDVIDSMLVCAPILYSYLMLRLPGLDWF